MQHRLTPFFAWYWFIIFVMCKTLQSLITVQPSHTASWCEVSKFSIKTSTWSGITRGLIIILILVLKTRLAWTFNMGISKLLAKMIFLINIFYSLTQEKLVFRNIISISSHLIQCTCSNIFNCKPRDQLSRKCLYVKWNIQLLWLSE